MGGKGGAHPGASAAASGTAVPPPMFMPPCPVCAKPFLHRNTSARIQHVARCEGLVAAGRSVKRWAGCDATATAAVAGAAAAAGEAGRADAVNSPAQDQKGVGHPAQQVTEHAAQDANRDDAQQPAQAGAQHGAQADLAPDPLLCVEDDAWMLPDGARSGHPAGAGARHATIDRTDAADAPAAADDDADADDGDAADDDADAAADDDAEGNVGEDVHAGAVDGIRSSGDTAHSVSAPSTASHASSTCVGVKHGIFTFSVDGIVDCSGLGRLGRASALP